MPSTCLYCSTLTCLALVLFAFVRSLPPRATARPYRQNHQLAQDENPRPERVQPSVTQRFLQRDIGLSEYESSDTAEAAVHSDDRAEERPGLESTMYAAVLEYIHLNSCIIETAMRVHVRGEEAD
jgi:hypothetical protein